MSREKEFQYFQILAFVLENTLNLIFEESDRTGQHALISLRFDKRNKLILSLVPSVKNSPAPTIKKVIFWPFFALTVNLITEAV